MHHTPLSCRKSHPALLPQELSDCIISHLEHDRISLKQCSLVCRSWLISSRIHLFRKLVITPKNFAFLVSFVGNSQFIVLPFIKGVEFRDLDLSSHWGAATGLVPHFSLALTHLHLYDVAFNTFMDIIDVICVLPYIQSIGIDHVHWDADSTGATNIDVTHVQKQVLPPSVDHIRWRDTPLHELMLWFLSHDKLPQVPYLDIGPIKERDVSSAGRYLFQVGPILQHLGFSFSVGNYHECTSLPDPGRSNNKPSLAERYREIFGVSTCDHVAILTGLRSLRIDDFVDYHELNSNHNTSAFCAPRVFASLRSRKLARLILVVTLERAGNLDQFDVNWEFLDEAFASEAYETLEVIEFEIRGKVNIEGLKELISSRLPCAAARGLLNFYKAA